MDVKGSRELPVRSAIATCRVARQIKTSGVDYPCKRCFDPGVYAVGSCQQKGTQKWTALVVCSVQAWSGAVKSGCCGMAARQQPCCSSHSLHTQCMVAYRSLPCPLPPYRNPPSHTHHSSTHMHSSVQACEAHSTPVLLEFSFIKVICQCKADGRLCTQLILLVQPIQQCCAAGIVLGNGCGAIQPKARVDPVLDQRDVMAKPLGQFFQALALLLQQYCPVKTEVTALGPTVRLQVRLREQSHGGGGWGGGEGIQTMAPISIKWSCAKMTTFVSFP